MKLGNLLGLACAAAISCMLASTASAEDKVVKIGAVFPLTGNAASAGLHAKYAIEVALDIINNAHPELGDLPLAKNAGLAGLGGAKVGVVYADNQGSPATGQNQALRLITEEKVAALTGAYQSGITLTASAIAEKYGIPFVNGESVASNLTERGFKWFFRTTPIATDFVRVYYDFLTDMKAQGAKVDNIALVHDNTEYGTSVANTIAAGFKEKGLNTTDISYVSNATDVQSQVLQLKDRRPDVLLFVSYTADAILYVKTMKSLDYKPPLMIADNAGVRIGGEVTDGGRMPMITSRETALIVQTLLHHGPFALGGNDKGMEIDLEAVGNRVVVDSRCQPACPDQRLTVETTPLRNRSQFVRSITRVPAASTANINAEFIGTAMQSSLQGTHHRGGDS